MYERKELEFLPPVFLTLTLTLFETVSLSLKSKCEEEGKKSKFVAVSNSVTGRSFDSFTTRPGLGCGSNKESLSILLSCSRLPWVITRVVGEGGGVRWTSIKESSRSPSTEASYRALPSIFTRTTMKSTVKIILNLNHNF